MHARQPGRLDHVVVVVLAAEAADIGGNGVGEQLDVLRQIAEMTAERFARPDRDIGAVEAHRPGGGASTPTIWRASVDLPAPGRADHAQHFAGLDPEADAAQDRRVGCRGMP